jgi:16S rRNA (guanine527-N7)-methyltransferase
VFAAMKGKRPEAEIQALPAGVQCRKVIALRIPFLDAERHLVLCELKP